MIRFVFLCLLVGAGLIAGPLLLDQKGYVLIAMGNLTVEMSVVSMGITLVGLYALLLILEWVWRKLTGLNRQSLQWWQSRGRRSQQKLAQGLSALELKNTALAERQLKGLDHRYFEGVTLMALAKCALQKDDSSQALDYWQQASQYSKSASAAHAHLADFYLQTQQLESAEHHLAQISDKDQHWANILELKLQCSAQQNQWDQVRTTLKKYKKFLPAQRFNYWQHASSTGELAEVASKSGALELKQSWQNKSRAERRDPATQAAYVQQLLGQNMHQEAEDALVEYQKKGPHPLLLPLFKDLNLPQPIAAKKLLESWLKKDDTNAELYSVLGHLALSSKDWILADKALSSAIRLAPNKEDQLSLAKAKEQQGQQEQALQLYKQASA